MTVRRVRSSALLGGLPPALKRFSIVSMPLEAPQHSLHYMRRGLRNVFSVISVLLGYIRLPFGNLLGALLAYPALHIVRLVYGVR